MGFKDLQVLGLLVWLFLGHAFQVGAQVPASPVPAPPSPPPNSTEPRQWNVTRNPEDTETAVTQILRSQNGLFSFDLLLTNQSKSFCAATVRHISSDTTVWVANFNVSNSDEQSNSSNTTECFLSFTQNDGLVLNSSNGKEIWRTKLVNRGNLEMLQLDDSGCLSVITNGNDQVWRSFDYPSDTLIKGQQLKINTSMSAAQLNQEYSTGGVFFMRIDGANLTLYQDFEANSTPRYIPYSSLFSNVTGNDIQNITYVEMESSLLAFYGTQSRTLANTSGIWDYVRLESNGGLVLKAYNSTNQEELVGNDNDCSLPGKCGSFGICLPRSGCKCPTGFEKANFTESFTCQRIQALNPTDCLSDEIVNVTGQYLSISDFSTGVDINRTDCEQRCRTDCNCTNALHVRRSLSSFLGVCYLNLDSVQTIRQTTSDDLQMLFLKIPAIPSAPNPGSPSGGGGSSSRRTAASAFAGGAGALVLVLLALSAWCLAISRRKLFDEADRGLYNPAAVGMLPPQLPPQYTYKQLVESTSNFAQRLGYASWSSVYAGNLADTNTKIAVKNLGENGHKNDFLAAVATMGSLSHANLVPLVGFCKDGKHKMLVYELVNEGRSLNWFLFNTHDSGPLINASTRREIALGTAQGLQYLHSAHLIHGGVKPENIMIDRAKHPKLVDYGLVTLTTRFQRLNSATSHGARAYMAPEWLQSQPVGEKADVYSLGVVILELVSGRRCLIPNAIPEERRFLPTWGFSVLGRGNGDPDAVLELVDPRLDIKFLSGFDQQVLKGMTFVALWCVQEDPNMRPPMEQVAKMLEGHHIVDTPPVSPGLDTFARSLCAGGEEPGGMHPPSLPENAETRLR